MRFVYGLVGACIGPTVSLGAALLSIDFWPYSEQGITGAGLCSVLMVGALAGVLVSETTVWKHIGGHAGDKPSFRRKAARTAGWIAIPVACAFGMVLLGDYAQKPPSDAELIANFYKNRASLEKIVSMNQAGPIFVEGNDAEGVSGKSLVDLRRLLKASQVNGSFQSVGGSMLFICWSGTGVILPYQAHKGYVYSDTDPLNDRQSLDSLPVHSRMEIKCFRHITGNWYLYLNNNSDDIIAV